MSRLYSVTQVDVERIALPNGKMMAASKFGGDMSSEHQELQLSADEVDIQTKARGIWKGILNVDIEDSTDFFDCGAGSMDVVRYPIICLPCWLFLILTQQLLS